MSILGLVYRSSRVTIDVMGKVPGEKAAWGALENHSERITLPGVLILRLNESLFWVNATRVHDEVLALAEDFPETRAIVLDLESTDQLEITSADMLGMLLDRLRDRGIDLYLVQVRFRVRSVLKRTGVRERLGEDHLWHSISQGVRSAREDHGLKPARAPGAEPAVPDEVEEVALPEDELVIATTAPVEPDDETDIDDARWAAADGSSRRTMRRF
jgi:MFS superfamily sulfate permease-like transporter